MDEVLLYPGDYHFGGADTRIHTVLGSCVSITAWHAGRRIGGMCHFMLPARDGYRRDARRADRPDGRYADGAIELLLDDMRRAGTDPGQYEVKMFGGGEQFPGPLPVDVAGDNIDAGLRLLERNGLTLTARDLGGTGSRRLIFDIATGDVWMRALAVRTS